MKAYLGGIESSTVFAVQLALIYIFQIEKCEIVFLQSEKRSSNFMYLMVEFPRVKSNDKEYSIVYYEKVISWLLVAAHSR